MGHVGDWRLESLFAMELAPCFTTSTLLHLSKLLYCSPSPCKGLVVTIFLRLNGPPPMVKCVAEDAVWYAVLWCGTVGMSQATVKWYVPSVTSGPGSSGPPQCADVCRQPMCNTPYNMCTTVQSTLWTTTCVDTSLCASYHPGQQSIAPWNCHTRGAL